jgi:hypothetical protein
MKKEMIGDNFRKAAKIHQKFDRGDRSAEPFKTPFELIPIERNP